MGWAEGTGYREADEADEEAAMAFDREIAISERFLRVDAVWSSPLARCVQTALVALQPLVSPG